MKVQTIENERNISVSKNDVKQFLHILFMVIGIGLLIVTSVMYMSHWFDNEATRNRNQSTQNNSTTNNSNNLFRRGDVKIDFKKEMHQLGKHFNKHGREMGYASKKEYQKAAVDFAKKYLNSSEAEVYIGKYTSGSGVTGGNSQIAICAEGKSVILDEISGQIINFYRGTELRGLINLVPIF